MGFFKKRNFPSPKNKLKENLSSINSDVSTNSEGESIGSPISSISVKSYSLCDDEESISSSFLIDKNFPNECEFQLKAVQKNLITNKEEVISTFQCEYSETPTNSSLLIFIENINSYSAFNKETMLKLLEFISKISVRETFVFINRNHSEYSKY
jgi:hypothetical protein